MRRAVPCSPGERRAARLIGHVTTLGPVVVPYLLTMSGNNWNVPIYVAAGTYLISMICWMFIDPVTPLERDQ